VLPPYSDTAPERPELDASSGAVVVEFGSNECGYCRQALPHITEAMTSVTAQHFRIQDGKGRRLGRSFGVKLWPTLIFLHNGKEVARVVRPESANEIMLAFKKSASA